MSAQLSPLVIGHRGASGYRPEHTAAAYRLAIALGADALEPDIVATKDGVLVLRHENEISTTTDVASRPEFAGRRCTKSIDGKRITGWFTEDFTWAELQTVRARERLPKLRQASSSFDGRYPILRLADLFELINRSQETTERTLAMVAEIKHATYFQSIGLPLDELFAAELGAAGWTGDGGRLTIESFEATVLRQIANRGIRGKRVYLVEESGRPFDQVAALGSRAPSYADVVSEAGLYTLATAPAVERMSGISVNASLLWSGGTRAARGRPAGDRAEADATESGIVDNAHSAGLELYCWTLRPENHFLPAAFRRGSAQAAYGDWIRWFRAVFDTGVDGVFADHPDLAVAVRNGLGQ